MLHEALGDDLRHHLGGVMLPLAAIAAQRERQGQDTNCAISLLGQDFCRWRGREFLRWGHVGAIAIPPTHRAVDLMEAKTSEAEGLSRARS